MTDQVKLNNELLSICTAQTVDYDRAEELLRQGAQPMGQVNEGYDISNLYFEVVEELFDNDDTPIDFYLITKLFLKYGLDVSKPAVPYGFANDEHDDITNPLWMFSFRSNDVVKETLKLLLDNGLRSEDAAMCWGCSVGDLITLGCDLRDEWERGEFIDYIKKVLLIASYPHVLNDDKNLQEEIWCDQNDYDLIKFRNWNDYEYEFDTTRCEKYPSAWKSIVTVIEKTSGKAVWKFGVGLKPEEK